MPSDAPAPMSIARRAATEALGTAFLLASVVGSGVMAQQLSGGNVALALLANALATGGALVALLFALGPVSGAHLNPVVSLVLAWRGDLPRRDVGAYLIAQTLGAVAGVLVAHIVFSLPYTSAFEPGRGGTAAFVSETVATFGLVLVVWRVSRSHPVAVPYAVAAYIVSAYWFTSSTSFANPAVTLARALTGSFSGIRVEDVPLFVAAQLLGGGLAASYCAWIDAGETAATAGRGGGPPARTQRK